MNNIIQEKSDLRKVMLSKRAQLNRDLKKQKDETLCKVIEDKIVQLKAQHIHVFLPMGAEPNIYPLLQRLLDSGKSLYAPKTLPKPVLQNRPLTSLDDIEAGVFGTKHPAEAVEYKGDFDFIIVPGLAFDNQNYRLGYGGGYYDNFLSAHPEAFCFGIGYDFQLVDNVPIEEHDIVLDLITLS